MEKRSHMHAVLCCQYCISYIVHGTVLRPIPVYTFWKPVCTAALSYSFTNYSTPEGKVDFLQISVKRSSLDIPQKFLYQPQVSTSRGVKKATCFVTLPATETVNSDFLLL